MTFSEQAEAIRRRRARNPEREARRQAELTRVSQRFDYHPTYEDIRDGRGAIVKATYLGHQAVLIRPVRPQFTGPVGQTPAERAMARRGSLV